MWLLLKHSLVLLPNISAVFFAIAGVIQLARAGDLIPAPSYSASWQFCDAVRDLQHPDDQMWLQWRRYEHYMAIRAILLGYALGASLMAMICFLIATRLAEWDGYGVVLVGGLLFLEVWIANSMCWRAGGW